MTPFDISRIQSRAWQSLAKSYQLGRIGGTYLFHGPEGTGKWSLAIWLAALLNCDQSGVPEEGCLPSPCGQCWECRSIFSLNFEGLYFALPIPPHRNFDEAIDLTSELLNLKRIEPMARLVAPTGANIPIAVARDIKKRLSRRAAAGVVRLVLFYQMEKMLPSSADALLKLIEEPPRDTIIVMTATRPESLLPTLQSRSRKIRLHRVPDQVIKDYLTQRYGTSERQAVLAARLSEGCLGDAIDLVQTSPEQDSSRRTDGFLLFRSLLSDSAPEAISRITEFAGPRDRDGARSLLYLWQSLTRDCARYAITAREDEIVNIDFQSEIIKLAALFSGSQLPFQLVDNIKIALADLRRNVHIQGALTALALKVKAGMSGGAGR